MSVNTGLERDEPDSPLWTEWWCLLGVLAKPGGDVGDALGVINELFVLIVALTTDQREI